MEVPTDEITREVTRRELAELWISSVKFRKADSVFNYLKTNFKVENVCDTSESAIKQDLSRILAKFSEKWQCCKRTKSLFFEKNKEWLERSFHIKFKVESAFLTSSASTSRGRPSKDFDDCGDKAKKRRVKDILEERSCSEVTFAASTSLWASGKRDASRIVKEVSKTPDCATELKKLKVQQVEEKRKFTDDEALALYIDCDLSKHSYNLLRNHSSHLGHDIYPSYYAISKAKKRCYPTENLTTSESRVAASLQSLLDLTVKRLILSQMEIIKPFLQDNQKFELISKWGGDGSSGHSRYKQVFQNANDNDEHLFSFSFVPLKLCPVSNESLALVWCNSRPSSTRFCRPIKLIFAKENDEMARIEFSAIQNEIDHLNPTKIELFNTDIYVEHKLFMTMIDGKICNAISETQSTQTCYICGATPRTMNLPQSTSASEENYNFGLSTLHAWIRSLECFLNISYRLDVKKWSVRSAEDKQSVMTRKENIQLKFKKEMGLIIDKPKPGYGSSNDGNTARRFFKNYEKTSVITGLDAPLLKRFYLLLTTLSSNYKINETAFEKFICETRELYLQMYSWYYMPVTIHKLLTHSLKIINQFLLPIGMMSEEAQEARNKDIREFREHHTRKKSRIASNEDLFSTLLVTSDPVISCLRMTSLKKKGSLPQGVLSLLEVPNQERDNAESPNCTDSESE